MRLLLPRKREEKGIVVIKHPYKRIVGADGRVYYVSEILGSEGGYIIAIDHMGRLIKIPAHATKRVMLMLPLLLLLLLTFIAPPHVIGDEYVYSRLVYFTSTVNATGTVVVPVYTGSSVFGNYSLMVTDIASGRLLDYYVVSSRLVLVAVENITNTTRYMKVQYPGDQPYSTSFLYHVIDAYNIDDYLFEGDYTVDAYGTINASYLKFWSFQVPFSDGGYPAFAVHMLSLRKLEIDVWNSHKLANFTLSRLWVSGDLMRYNVYINGSLYDFILVPTTSDAIVVALNKSETSLNILVHYGYKSIAKYTITVTEDPGGVYLYLWGWRGDKIVVFNSLYYGLYSKGYVTHVYMGDIISPSSFTLVFQVLHPGFFIEYDGLRVRYGVDPSLPSPITLKGFSGYRLVVISTYSTYITTLVNTTIEGDLYRIPSEIPSTVLLVFDIDNKKITVYINRYTPIAIGYPTSFTRTEAGEGNVTSIVSIAGETNILLTAVTIMVCTAVVLVGARYTVFQAVTVGAYLASIFGLLAGYMTVYFLFIFIAFMALAWEGGRRLRESRP